MRRAERIGIPLRAVDYGNAHGAFAQSPQGRPGMFYISYYATTGCELIGYHAESGELVKVPLPSGGGYGLCLGSDGALYVGGVGPGDLYRYDPAAGSLDTLGGSEFGVEYMWQLVANDDGKIYGCCFPTCNVIEYDISSGSLIDLGPLSDTEKYTRALCLDAGGRIWAGVGMRAGLVRINPASGQRREMLPERYRESSCCRNLFSSGRYVSTSLSHDGVVLVFDSETGDLVRTVPRPADGGGWMHTVGAPAGSIYLYNSPSGDLYQYDIEGDTLSLLAQGLGQCEHVVDGRYVHGIDDQDYFLFDLTRGEDLDRKRLTEATDGMRIQTLAAGADGHLYGSTYICQHMFRYDAEKEELSDLGRVMRLGGQVDSMHAGRDGKIYMGSYIRATLSIYDPTRPWQPGQEGDSNPRELGRIGHGQYRTCSTVLGPDGNMWVGSIPDYNSGPTGALTRWDPRTDEHRSWTDLVPGGAIRRAIVDDRYLYCAGGGRFFVWDPGTESKICELELNVSSLALLRDGSVLISASDDLSVFDPVSMSVARTFASPIGPMNSLAVLPDGQVYGMNADAVARIDPIAGTGEKVADEGGTLLTADARGDLYFARHAELYRFA